jgi:hypothetical protein
MKKFLALGYMLALPLVSGAKILPSVALIILFSTVASAPGVLATILPGFGVAQAVSLLTSSTALSFLITGLFPPGTAANWIMGL